MARQLGAALACRTTMPTGMIRLPSFLAAQTSMSSSMGQGRRLGKEPEASASRRTACQLRATAGLPQIDLRKVFWRQLQILGSTMGNESEFAEMVALVAAGKLRPLIDQVYPLASAQQAHLRMEHSQHMGKLVLPDSRLMLDLLAAIERYLDVLRVERGLSAHTLSAMRATFSRLPITWPNTIRRAATDVTALSARHGLGFAVSLGQRQPLRSQARMLSLRGLGKFLRRENLVPSDPMAGSRAAQKSDPLPHSVGQTDIEALLARPDVQTPRGARDAAMIEVLYSTGLRVSELCKLAIADGVRALYVPSAKVQKPGLCCWASGA